MVRPAKCNNNFKRHKKLITIVLLYVLIFPTIAISVLGHCFNSVSSSDETKPNSANEWQKWKDEQGEPFYINHGIKKAQRERPEKFNTGKDYHITELPYPETMDAKIKLFYAQIDKSAYINEIRKKYFIHVSRSNILADSFKAVMGGKAKRNLRKVLKLEFENEENTESRESLAKEWFSLLSDEISDPQNGLFKYVDDDNYELEINPESKNLTYYFKFIGRVVGAAVYRQIPLNMPFVKPYYKVMLSKTIELADVEAADRIYYNSLLEADVATLKNYVSSTRNTKTKTDLISKIIRKKYQTSVKNQMSAFLEGFADLIPLRLLRIFTADELKELIVGVQSIDVDDWIENTDYDNNDQRNEKEVQWFWEIVREFTNEEKRRLLQFVVGTSTVPFNGFQGLMPKFKIRIVHSEEADQLPKAKVCFNVIVLTEYSSEETLRELLRIAIEATHSFQLN